MWSEFLKYSPKAVLVYLDEIEDLVHLLVKLLDPIWFPFYLFLLLVASLCLLMFEICRLVLFLKQACLKLAISMLFHG